MRVTALLLLLCACSPLGSCLTITYRSLPSPDQAEPVYFAGAHGFARIYRHNRELWPLLVPATPLLLADLCLSSLHDVMVWEPVPVPEPAEAEEGYGR